MKNKLKFFFFIEVADENAQTWAHITSALGVAYVLDLFLDINPVKDFYKSIFPGTSKDDTTTT